MYGILLGISINNRRIYARLPGIRHGIPSADTRIDRNAKV